MSLDGCHNDAVSTCIVQAGMLGLPVYAHMHEAVAMSWHMLSFFLGSVFVSFAQGMLAVNRSQFSPVTALDSDQCGASGSRHTAAQDALVGPQQAVCGVAVK